MNFKIKNIASIIILCFCFSCTEEFLEVDPGAIQIETNYYKNSSEAFAGLVAAYDPLGWEGGKGGEYGNIGSLIAASDECHGGGGSVSDVPYLNIMDDFAMDAANGPQLGYWQKNFTGVARANTIIEKLQEQINDLSEEERMRFLAEAKFLRAHFYFDLVRLFGNVPLFTASLSTEDIFEVEQATPDVIYAQIESDLTEAIQGNHLPDKVPVATEGGRATMGAARALLGKVYLYQEKWSQAAEHFAVVNGVPGASNQFGYKLLDSFSSVFRPDNKYHSESVLEIVHTDIAASGWGNTSLVEGHILGKMVGPRSYTGPIFYSGWGGCPVSLELVDVMQGDPRYYATIVDVDSLVDAGLATYLPGYENTGYFLRKIASLDAYKHTGAGAQPLNYNQNYIEIRLSDCYLMEAEAIVEAGGDLQRAADLLNAVRGRVNLEPIEPTLDNIHHERRLELATEGHRFFDLVRTGLAADVLGNKGFTPNKNEWLPIPLPELNNTKLVQNPGY